MLLASSVSIAGTRVSTIALPWLVYTETDSPGLTGLVLSAEMAPYVISKALGGPLVDRRGPRAISVFGDLLSGAFLVLIPILYAAGQLSLPQRIPLLLALVALAGAFRGPGDGARNAMIPAVSDATGMSIERITGLDSTLDRASGLLGAGIGGLLVATFGAAQTVAVTAGSALVSAVVVAVFISNWTTRPLDLLKNALARVGLQEANVPIRYRGDDEIGQLVEVYNRKVEELRESAELLARSERETAWREMARQVAHEIKNPLTPMKLSIQHFQRTWKPDAPDAEARLERFSSGMVEQIDTLSGIASAFSNFAQMPRAKAEELDLGELVGTAVSLFDATPGVSCTLDRQHTGPLPVRADREQLLRVFNNLLKNAVQSIPDEREGHVAIILRSTGTEVLAEVRDNGSGIADEDLERIFSPNFTTKSSGMGLGLAMVKRMVESAGGRVWFETEGGKGTSFFVALPLGKA